MHRISLGNITGRSASFSQGAEKESGFGVTGRLAPRLREALFLISRSRVCVRILQVLLPGNSALGEII
ncbi:MAG: hypothetical protein JXD19_00980 [Deltaproteobacteria bacterium]|nr:hypothetical protein [Deltaproteobacteria bacterium]